MAAVLSPRRPPESIRLTAFGVGSLEAHLHVDHHGEKDAADEDAEGAQGLIQEVVGVDDAEGREGQEADDGFEIGVDFLELFLAAVGDSLHHHDAKENKNQNDFMGQRFVGKVKDRGHEKTEECGIGRHRFAFPTRMCGLFELDEASLALKSTKIKSHAERLLN